MSTDDNLTNDIVINNRGTSGFSYSEGVNLSSYGFGLGSFAARYDNRLASDGSLENSYQITAFNIQFRFTSSVSDPSSYKFDVGLGASFGAVWGKDGPGLVSAGGAFRVTNDSFGLVAKGGINGPAGRIGGRLSGTYHSAGIYQPASWPYIHQNISDGISNLNPAVFGDGVSALAFSEYSPLTNVRNQYSITDGYGDTTSYSFLDNGLIVDQFGEFAGLQSGGNYNASQREAFSILHSGSSYDWGSSYNYSSYSPLQRGTNSAFQSTPFQYSGYTGGANNNYGFSTGFNDYSLGGTSYNSNYISDPSAPYSSLFGSGSSYDWGASYSTPTSSYSSNPFSYSGYTGGGSSSYGYSTGFNDYSYSGGSSYDYSSSYSGSSSSSYISSSDFSSSYSSDFTYSGYTGGSSSYGGSSFGSWGSWGWPVVLDLDGDGVEIVTLDQSPAFFDFDEDSYQENTAWAGGDDGILVIDLAADGTDGAGDGVIDQAKEVAFAGWHEDARTDLEGVQLAFDSNDDGVLDASDERFDEFRIWQDANQNGVSDDGELKTLAEAGIESLNLTSDGELVGYSDGTIVFGETTFTKTDGTTGTAADVALKYNPLGYRIEETDNGFKIAFEQGDDLNYFSAAADDTTDASIDLSADNLAGAFGGAGNDQFSTSGEEAIVASGGAGDDTIAGGAGSDWISGDEGADNLSGGAGHDIIFFDADDTSIDGGEGYDVAFTSTEAAVNLNLTDTNIEAAYGNAGDDTFTATGEQSVIVSAGDGADIITTDEGNDILSGDAGDDVISSGAGNDMLIGGDGVDTLNAGTGSDILAGGTGDGDVLLGGDGQDTYIYNKGDGLDEIQDSPTAADNRESDTLILGGVELKDVQFVVEGQNLVIGITEEGVSEFSALKDRVTVKDWLSQNNRVEWISFASGLILNLAPIAEVLTGTANADTLTGSDDAALVDAGAGDDTVTTGAGDDIILARDGANVIETGAGADKVIGGLGADTIRSGSDNDQVTGGAGNDTIEAGSGNDIAIGGEGDDNISGEDGNDQLYGSEGNDSIYGGFGNDTLSGGTGNDRLEGGYGNDTYNYNRGDGQDIIADHYEEQRQVRVRQAYSVRRRRKVGKRVKWVRETRYRTVTQTQTQEFNAGDDILKFGVGISVDDLFLTTSGSNLVVGLREFNEDGSEVATTNFEDKITIENWSDSKDRIEEFQLADGIILDMADITYARSAHNGNDTLNGKSGGDFLSGGAGNDTLRGYAGNDILVGGSGDDSLKGEAGNDTLFGGTDNDTLDGGAGEDNLYGGLGDDTLKGGDDKDYLLGNAGDDTIYGGAGDDVITGGAGNDILKGGLGDDVYSFNRGDGHDTIDEYAETTVREAYTYTTRRYVRGSKWRPGYWVNNTRTGYRTKTVQTDGGEDTLQFGSNIAVSDLFLTMNGDNLVVGIKDLEGAFNEDYYLAANPDVAQAIADRQYVSGYHHFLVEGYETGLDGTDPNTFEDQVTVLNWTDEKTRLEWFRFSDDVSIDMSAIEVAQSGGDGDDLLTATSASGTWLAGDAGDDTLTGNSGNDILFGGTGDDSISGGEGDDTYIYSHGDGADTFTDTGGADYILFGNNISLEDLKLKIENGSLQLSISDDDANDQISISNWDNAANRIETLQFNDGVDFDLGRMNSFFNGVADQENTLAGTTDNDWIDGQDLDDTITAGDGHDTIFGREGDDTIDGQAGDDLIFAGSGNDHVTGGAGNNIIFAGLGDDTLIGHDETDVISGEEGNDIIYGGAGDDHISGDAGDDTYVVSSGTDTYYLGVGEGNDIFRTSYSDASIPGASDLSTVKHTDKVVFEGGVQAEHLWFSQEGNDLLVNILGDSSSFTFKEWFTSENNQSVNEFTAGERTLGHSQIDQLVSAMAGYEPSDGTNAYGITIDRLPETVQLAVANTWQASA